MARSGRYGQGVISIAKWIKSCHSQVVLDSSRCIEFNLGLEAITTTRSVINIRHAGEITCGLVRYGVQPEPGVKTGIITGVDELELSIDISRSRRRKISC